MTHGRSVGRGRYSSCNRPPCQLYGKHGHDVSHYWHRFDETFTPTHAQSNLLEFKSATTDKHEASTSDSQATTMMASTLEYSLPIKLEKKAWFVDLLI